MKLYEEDVKRRLDEISLNKPTKVGNKTFQLSPEELNQEIEDTKKQFNVSTYNNLDTKEAINKLTVNEGISDINHILSMMMNNGQYDIIPEKDLYLYNLFLEKFDVKKLSKGANYDAAYKRMEKALLEAQHQKKLLNSKYNKDMKGFKPKKLKKKYVDFGDDLSSVSSYSTKKQAPKIDDKDEIKNILSEMTHHIENEDKKQTQQKNIQTKAAEKIQKAWKLGVKPKQTIAAEAKAEEKAEAKAEDKKTSDIIVESIAGGGGPSPEAKQEAKEEAKEAKKEAKQEAKQEAKTPAKKTFLKKRRR